MPQNRINRLDQIMRYLMLAVAGMLILLAVLTIVFFATKPAAQPTGSPSGKPNGGTSAVDTSGGTTGSTLPPTPAGDDVTLPETPDAGVAYQDSIVFVGDSLTAHLINRGVLTGGRNTKQVWRTENNMLNLNSEVLNAKIIFPGTGALMTIAEAAGKAKPAVLVITLGTDWGVAYLGETDFKACYTKLVTAVQKASPKTTVVLQSIFPVTAGCTVLDNQKIDTANRWVKAIAAETGCRYLDTQSILKDANNCLKEEYCNSSDGIHLSENAYTAILTYIRTHAVTD